MAARGPDAATTIGRLWLRTDPVGGRGTSGPALRELTADGVRHLVLDLTPVSSLASSGISMLVTALAEARGIDRVHLVGVANNAYVRRVLDLTGVRERFADHDDVDGLLAALDAGE